MPGLSHPTRSLSLLAALAVVAAVSAAVMPRALLHGQSQEAPPAETDAVVIQADYAQQWIPDAAPAGTDAADGLLRRGPAGAFFIGDRPVPQDEVLILRGRCRLAQGTTSLRADKMVLWRRHDDTGRAPQDRLVVYLEGNVLLERPGQTVNEPSMFINLASKSGVDITAPHRIDGQPATGDALYQRAVDRRQGARRNSLRPTQLVVPGPEGPLNGPMVQVQPAGGIRRVRISPRSALPFDVTSFPATSTVPPEQVWVLTGGVNVLINDVPEYGTVDLSADRMVIWTRSVEGEEFRTEIVQSSDTPFTVYLEGNIVIRQQGALPGMGLPNPKVVRAAQAVYDARDERALILNAELRTFIPQIGGDLRLKAERIRQLMQDTYYAQNAWTTTSQFGKPGYRLQATDVFIEPRIVEPLFGASPFAVSPLTGQPWGEPVPWVTSLNNTFYIHDVPVFYLPRVSGPAEDPNIPLRNITVRQDRIFGFSTKVTWDLYELLGWDDPPGTRWSLYTDYYSDRGPAVGTGGNYRGTDLFGIPGQYWGQGLGYYVHDSGRDTLGLLSREDIPLETENRYWIELRHKHLLPNNLEFRGELGLLSDRNFLEQYFESAWDTGKDVETLAYLKQQYDDNQAWSVLVQPEVNDFAVTTEWYPQADHFLLGERLLEDVFTWYAHSEISYADLEPGGPPEVPGADIFTPIPYKPDVDGALAMTRHELDMPFNLGPVKVVPYGMGEASYFGEGFDGEPVSRLWSSVGVRSSLMFWRVYPYAQSRILNVNGLAHKVLWDLEAYTSHTTTDLDEIPQYHDFDDNAQQRFRQRFQLLTFGGQVPRELDPRKYGVRTGAGHSVSAPWYELVDDLQVVRLAMRQRLQTKVGPPERLRIRDWMTLDLEASFFPDQDGDNFGEPFGLLGGRYLWAVGDRTSITANALYDPFEFGQRLWDVGFSTQRDARGTLYLGYRQVHATPTITSQFVIASYTYVMSPKWNTMFSSAYDVGEDRNLGQQVSFTRVGADWLFHIGANYDAGKDNFGFAVALEPRLGALVGGLAPTILSMFNPLAGPTSSGR